MPSVYLAGPIAGKTFEDAVGWRDDATLRLHGLGYDVYAPMRARREELSEMVTMALEEDTFTFERDAYDISRADILLVNWLGVEGTVSIGTAVEMGMGHAQGKFILTVIEHPSKVIYPLAHDGKYHPFITGPSTVIVHSLEAAYQFLESVMPAKPAKVELPGIFTNWEPWSPPTYGDTMEGDGFNEQAEYFTTEHEQDLYILENDDDY